MVNPDNTVKYIPSDERETSEDQYSLSPVKPSDAANRDFKKILSKDSKEDSSKKKKSPAEMFSEEKIESALPSDVEDITDKDNQENATQGVFTVFDLSKKSEKDKRVSVSKESSQHAESAISANKSESPNDLFKRMSATRSIQKDSEDSESLKKSQSEKKISSIYHTEQTDLSYVNPLASQASQSQASFASGFSSKVERTSDIDPNLPLLIEQLVKQMYTVQHEGQTDTVMTLQYPPIFKDAKLTVSAFDTAKGQFNITFENLTQQAQKILDMQTNKQSLFTALEQKGYNVHIYMTSTTQIENLNLSEQQSSHDKEEQRQGGSPKHRRGQG